MNSSYLQICVSAGPADKQEVALTQHPPPVCVSDPTPSPVCLSGLHAERPREGDRPAEDHGEGAGEEAASRHLHLRRRAQPQDQRPDQGHEQPAAGTDSRYVHFLSEAPASSQRCV